LWQSSHNVFAKVRTLLNAVKHIALERLLLTVWAVAVNWHWLNYSLLFLNASGLVTIRLCSCFHRKSPRIPIINILSWLRAYISMIDFPKNWSSNIYLPEREKHCWDGKFPIGGLRSGARNVWLRYAWFMNSGDQYYWKYWFLNFFCVFGKIDRAAILVLRRRIPPRRFDSSITTAIWELH
jgi:hypothetical protein